MINIQKKLKQQQQQKNSNAEPISNQSDVINKKTSIDLRQRLLQKEFEDIQKKLPFGCRIDFENPDILHEFKLTIKPDEDSLWNNGTFDFTITVPEGYNFEVKFKRSIVLL
jgi:ubiquitin-protein ligase